MNEYLDSIRARDPAAKSILSVILTYPGVKAVFFHRIAHFFCEAKEAIKRIDVVSRPIFATNVKRLSTVIAKT